MTSGTKWFTKNNKPNLSAIGRDLNNITDGEFPLDRLHNLKKKKTSGVKKLLSVYILGAYCVANNITIEKLRLFVDMYNLMKGGSNEQE